MSAGVRVATEITVSAAAFPRSREAKLFEFEEQLLCGILPDDVATEGEIAIRDSQWNSVKLHDADVVNRLYPDDAIVGEDGLTDAERQVGN